MLFKISFVAYAVIFVGIKRSSMIEVRLDFSRSKIGNKEMRLSIRFRIHFELEPIFLHSLEILEIANYADNNSFTLMIMEAKITKCTYSILALPQIFFVCTHPS